MEGNSVYMNGQEPRGITERSYKWKSPPDKTIIKLDLEEDPKSSLT